MEGFELSIKDFGINLGIHLGNLTKNLNIRD